MYPASRGLFDLPRSVGKRKRPLLAGSTFPVEHALNLNVTWPLSASLSLILSHLVSCEEPRGRWYRQCHCQFVSKRNCVSSFNPGDSIMESTGILGSPKMPVKKVTSKSRAASKDLACLLCGMSLVGERCTFKRGK